MARKSNMPTPFLRAFSKVGISTKNDEELYIVGDHGDTSLDELWVYNMVGNMVYYLTSYMDIQSDETVGDLASGPNGELFFVRNPHALDDKQFTIMGCKD